MTHRPALVPMAALLLLCVMPCSANIILVKRDSPGPTFDGASWDTAFHTVQAGLSASASGDEVWVAKGTYVERITLKTGVGLYGGFVGIETARDQRDFQANETILDGNKSGSAVTSPHYATGTTRIDGFTIRQGKQQLGGGMYVVWSSPTIANNIFTGNEGTGTGIWTRGGAIFCQSSSPTIIGNSFNDNIASYSGGAIYCQSSSPTITGNVFTGNTAPNGGAIACYTNSSPTIEGNVITGNSASAGGAGIYCTGSGATIAHNTIAGNTALADGGGISCTSSPATITHNLISANSGRNGGGVHIQACSPAIVNNTVASNTASNYGGGIYCYSYVDSAITNNTVAGNSAPRAGGVYLCFSSPAFSNNIVAFNSSGILSTEVTPVLRNNCVWGNTGCDYDGLSAGTGDISEDPMFVDPAHGDYHMGPGSPCISAGWNDAPGLPATDLDGESRIMFNTVDIGADEFPLGATLAYTKLVPDGGSVSLDDLIVSTVFDGRFYVEADDRSAGMQAEKAEHGIHAGSRVSITGTLRTNDDGERYIAAETVVSSGTGSILPLGLPNRSVGGTDWYYRPATGSGQRGLREWRLVKTGDDWIRLLTDLSGTNNVGLLVRAWGKVTYVGDAYFYLDDGSSLDDGSGHVGVRVNAEGLGLPALDSRVKVTGASSCYKRDGDLFRLVRATEIAPLQ